MSLIPRKIVFLAGVLLVVGACTGRPVENIESAPLPANRGLSMEEVENAIRRAAAKRGWTMKRLAPGRLEGRLALRSHVALVDVTFDTQQYSITYKDSQNLNYDGTNIHRNYNSWVRNLSNDINVEISAL